MKIKLDPGAIAPTRAHETDAGLDLYARDGCIVEAKGDAIFHTGVHVQIPHGCAGLLVSKSGLNVRYGNTSCLWMIAEACAALGCDLEDVMQLNIDKLKARYPDGFKVDQSLHRAEGDI